MDELEQKIKFVSTMFQVLAWPFAVLFVPASVVVVPIILYEAATDQNITLVGALGSSLFLVLLALAPIYVIRIGRRLRQGDPKASTPALAISGTMLLGFPLGTIVGVFFIQRILCDYEAYCRDVENSRAQFVTA